MDSLTWWIILLIGCGILELSSPGMFFFFSFSIGAAAAAIFALAFTSNPTTEFMVFLGVSLVAFFLLKRYIKSISKDTMYSTNVYALRGKKAIVVEPIIPFKKGWVSIDGQLWSALSIHEEIIEKGTLVEVVNSAGSHVVVRKTDIHL